jgi:TrmH family RNA methyltransferase
VVYLKNKNNTIQLESGISKNKIKFIRTLHQKKYRDENQLFIVEGVKMIEEALTFANALVQEVYTTDNQIFKNDSRIAVITDKELRQISSLKTPQKALAVLKYKPKSPAPETGIILALDGIQDPGNFGTILRTAEWFGVKEIICSKDTVDQYNPKSVQATMGSLFRVNVSYLNLELFVKNYANEVYGTLLSGKNIYQETLPENALIVMGNEGNGISKEIIPLISKPVLIPGTGAGESLNVSIATGIVLSEFKRNAL